MKTKMLLAGFVLFACATVSFGQTERLLRRLNAPPRATAAGDSFAAQFSPDGKYILFASDANDLCPGAYNGKANVFLRNIATGATQQISVGADSSPVDGDSEPGGITADNHYIVFQSTATNLVSVDGDTNGLRDIFLRELVTGSTTLISYVTNGANAACDAPQISRDGNWIVFETAADNLGLIDTNKTTDLYAWKRDDKTMHLVTANANGNSASIALGDFELSADSQNVLFTARGPNLATGAGVDKGRVYLRNLEDATTRCVSALLESDSDLANYSALTATLSASGRYIFVVATNGPAALVRIDLTNDSVVKIALDIDAPTNTLRRANAISVSDDGQFAAYLSHGAIYRWTSTNSSPELVDIAGNGISEFVQISHKGDLIAFLSDKSELGAPGLCLRDTRGFAPDDTSFLFESRESAFVANDSNNAMDLFLWTRANESISLLSPTSNASAKASGPGYAFLRQSTPDGRRIALTTWTSFNANDTNQLADLYVFDRARPTNILISTSTNEFAATTAAHFSVTRTSSSIEFLNTDTGEKKTWPIVATAYSYSADGMVIAYRAAVGSIGQIGVIDVQTGATNWISKNSFGELGNDNSDAPVVSPDGKWVAFESLASNLASEDRNNAKDVFVYQMTGAFGLASHIALGANLGPGWSFNPMFADSETLLFQSTATDLVAEPTDTFFNLYAVSLTPNPRIWLDVETVANARLLRWTAPKDARYQLEYKTELANSSWTALGSESIADGNEVSFSDTSGPGPRFYRLRILQ